ncbi:MAG: hypothetical protein LC804_25210 [Acidobacteria bacterium]|nr:hypothetical protein [Acidobacteriota bacterium]
MHSPVLDAEASAALGALAADLRRIFGARLLSLVAYGTAESADDDVHSLALVDRVRFDDLVACVSLTSGWRDRGLGVPLMLSLEEFRRSLDVFPLEYGEIIARHIVVEGTDPFAGIAVAEADRRRACELQAKSHLIHLREGFLETGGRPERVAELIAASAESFRSLLENIHQLDPRARSEMGLSDTLVSDVLATRTGGASTIAEPSALLARYITAAERVWQYVDGWRG